MRLHIIHQLFSVLIFLIATISCQNRNGAQEIVDKSIKAHGGEFFQQSIIEFDFRGRHYVRKRDKGIFEFRREWQDSLGFIQDIVNNEGFARLLNSEPIEVNPEWQAKYSRSVNSVIYFSLLPFRLNDPAVIKKLIGEDIIEGNEYLLVEIKFQQEGGGEDFQDVFIYWINKQNFEVDFFAYSYETDGGGVRFRAAQNKRRIGGILFQDYRNYSEPKESKLGLAEIGGEYKKGRLPLLSEINLEKITVSSLQEPIGK